MSEYDFSDAVNPFAQAEPAHLNETEYDFSNAINPFDQASNGQQSSTPKQLEADGIITASGKALSNVPERMQMSVAGLVQMFGEDLSSEKERYISDKARRIGISSGDFKLLAWAGEQGLVSKETPFNEALPELKKTVAHSLDKQQLKQLSEAGLFNPEEISSYGIELREDAKSTLAPINVEEGSAAFYASSAIGSLAEMGPMLAASIITRNPKIGAAIMGGQVGGQAYGEGREKGLSLREAQHYAVLTAAAEAAPEALVVGKLLKSGGGVLKGILKGTILESSQEAVTAALQSGIDQQYIDPDMTLSQALTRVRDGAIVGGIIGVPAGAATAIANKPRERQEQQLEAQKAQIEEAKIESIKSEKAYLDAIDTPPNLRTHEQNSVIQERTNSGLNESSDQAISDGTAMETASAAVDQAGIDAEEAGGDALDIASARSAEQSKQIPNAVRESNKQTRERKSNRSMEGLDGLIISARRLGFFEEEVRLGSAKNRYERASIAQQNGDLAAAQKLQREADAIVQDIVATTEPLAREAYDSFPVPFTSQGDVVGGELATAEQPNYEQPQTFDGKPSAKLTDNNQARLNSNDVIYGEEPGYSAQARHAEEFQREQREADNFNAFYGPNNPVAEPPLEGKFFASGEMEAAAKFRDSLPTQTALENNSFKQLETTNSIYVEPEAKDPVIPQSNVPEGIGENIINRMADLPTAIEHKPTISAAEFSELQSIYRRVIKTPLRERAKEDRAATAVYHQVKKGEIEIKNGGASPSVATSENSKEAKTLDTPSGKIADFGERIEGAKKHIYTFNEAISEDIDSSTMPLSKSFPKPDYEKLASSGIAPEKIALIAMDRARIGAKPRKGLKLQRWVAQVNAARHTAKSLLNTEATIKDLGRNKYGDHDEMTANIAKEILPSQIADLANFKIRKVFYQMYRQELNVTKFIAENIKTKVEKGFDSQEEALAYVKDQVTTTSDKGKPLAKFDIWSERGKPGYYIGKKVAAGKYLELHHVDTPTEARAYVKDNNERLVALLKEKKHIKAARRASNNPRIGKDYRENKDVTPELFSETFGFRGVQFGNWVEGDKRQSDLNNAYDGLLDLAELINVPPKALSLNGELGLAFGARGSGGKNAAMAHYEPSRVVINLTKKSGAGSLAHEWFHALDNYFGKMEKYQESGFVTGSKRPKRVRKVVDGNQVFTESVPSDFNIRAETYEAFKNIEKVISSQTKMIERSKELDKRRTKDYWSTVTEMTARSFEQYVIGKLAANNHESDYLANVTKEPTTEAGKLEYPYPLKAEMKVIVEAYDNLFDTLKTKKTDKGVALYSRNESESASPSANQEPSSPLSFDAVKTVADRLGRRLRLRGVSINVVSTESGLPEGIRQQAKEEGFEGEIDAVYQDKVIHIVADRMASIASVEEAVLHETAHFGGSALLGSELNKAYQKLSLKLGGKNGIRKKANELGFNMDQYFETADQLVKSGEMSVGERSEFLVDEFLAHASGAQANNKLPGNIKAAVQEFIGRVRDILRKLGISELAEISDSDIAFLLRKLREAAKGKTKFSDRPHFLSATDADIQEIVESNIQQASEQSTSKDAARFSSSGRGEPFASFIDRALQQTGRSGESYSLGDTPEVLQMLGADNLAVEITEGVIRKAVTGKHNLTAEVLQKIPDEINNPVMVFDSATEADSLIVLTELNNEEGLPVVVAVHLSKAKGRIEINSIASVHERSHARHIKNWIDQGLLAYRHKRKSRSWLQSRRLQLPWEGVKNDLRGKIITESDLGKGKAMFSRGVTSEQFSDLDDDQKSLLNKTGSKTTTRRITDRIKAALDRGGLKVRQGMVDKYAALFELDKKAHGEEVVEDHTRMSSWVLAKMSHAADGALAALMGHGRIRLNDGVVELKEKSDGLMGVLKKLGSPAEIDRFMGWIAANRSQKLADEGRENLFTKAEIKAGIRLNEGKTEKGKSRQKLYGEIFAEFQEYRNDVLKIAEESGIISSENRAMWKDEFYVPFYRVMEEDTAANKFAGTKGLSRQQAYKKLKGGNQELSDLLENTLMNFQHLLSSSLKNNAARQAMDNAVKVGIAESVIESNRDNKTSTFVLEKGVKQWYEISDPLVYESLTTLIDPGVSSFSRKMMRSFKRVFTSFITASPQFMVANSIRDTMHAMAIGNLSYNGFKNFAAGAKDYGSPIHKGKLKGDMLASGAAFSFGHVYGTGDPDALHAELERTINGAKVIRSPKDIP